MTPKAKTQIQTIHPLGDRVLIKQSEAQTKSAGGILLPENAKEKPREGIVIALGTGKLLDDGTRSEFSVETGDRVLFSPYAGAPVKHEGEEFLVVREEEILGVIRGR